MRRSGEGTRVQRVLLAMGAALLVAALGLFWYAGEADSEQMATGFRNTLAGATYTDPGPGGTPWRIAGGVSAGLGALLVIGAVAYDPSEG